MKKYIFMGAIGLFLLGSCTNKSAHEHEGHHHETEEQQHEGHGHEEHSHEHEGHNHENHKHNHEAHAHEGHKHEGHEGDNHAESSDEIVLSPEKAKAVGVVVKHVHPGTFQQVIKASGQVLAAQGDERMAVATVSGVVSLKGRVTEGISVSQGSPVITLSSSHMAEGDLVLRARIAYEAAKKEYDRMAKLVESKIVSQKDFLRAEEAYENARIAYEAVAKNHSAGGQAVTAPMSGYIKELLVKEGDYVEVGQPLFSITQNRKLFLRADVSEKYYGSLRTINSANFCTPYNNKVYSLSELNGRLLSYGKASGTDSYYVPVTFEFDNKSDIVPGSYVEVYLLSTPMENIISLPRTALTEEQGSYFVYRQIDKECYMKQLVTLGADNGKCVQILSGVGTHDNIVVEGAYQVKLAATTNAIPAHSHEH